MKISKFHYEVITHPYIQVHKTLKFSVDYHSELSECIILPNVCFSNFISGFKVI